MRVLGAGDSEKAVPKDRFHRFNFRLKTGAGEEIRTLDPNLGNRLNRSAASPTEYDQHRKINKINLRSFA